MSLSPDELINAAVSRSLISAEQVESLRLKAMRQRRPLVEVASHHARCPIVMLYCALAEQRGIPFIDLSTVTLDMNLVKRIPDALLKTRMVLPVADEGDEVLVATADPDDRGGLQNIARILGRPLRVALTDPDSLRETVKHVLAGQTAVHAAEDEDPVPICNRIFEQAYLRRASDIHLEAVPDGLRVRFRIDGRLQNYPTRIGQEMASSVISRMKVLSGLDIAEQRASQDGRFSFAAPGRDGATIDVRVATIPTRFGERITMRLLDSTATQLELGKIGMSDATLKRFRNMIQQPNGIVLMAGPTGSGKTSTLYAALEELNELHRNIVTVEDPVEYVVPGLSQVPIDGSDKMTFAKALRSLLRHDPDVLMIGEIRDEETAEIALHASMTGHFVFSTIHTNTACGAVSRLVEMGCPAYMVGSTLRGVISQRLVRRLCENCKRSREPYAGEVAWLGQPCAQLFEPVGCARCMGTGFRGRLGLFETLWVDQSIRMLINENVSEAELFDRAGSQLVTLRGDAALKVLDGITTIDEVMTVLDVDVEDFAKLDAGPDAEALQQVQELRQEVYAALATGEVKTPTRSTNEAAPALSSVGQKMS